MKQAVRHTATNDNTIKQTERLKQTYKNNETIITSAPQSN